MKTGTFDTVKSTPPGPRTSASPGNGEGVLSRFAWWERSRSFFTEVRVVGPKTLVPADMAQMGVRVCHSLEGGLKGCDVVIMLRLQNERMNGALLPSAGDHGTFMEIRLQVGPEPPDRP